MNANELRAEIERRRAALESVLREIETLEMQLDAVSREFIAANRITRDQVEPAKRQDGPWHFNLYEFGKWMRVNGCKKLWCEWNGRLYLTAEIMEGIIRPEAPGLWKHVIGE